MNTEPLTIDIWADIVCPFCFLGWQYIDAALKELPDVSQVSINWHSFQLNPELKPDPAVDLYDYLAKHKNETRQWAIDAHNTLKDQGKAVGIEFNFEHAVVANTAKAHELLKFAETQNLGHQMMLALFRAYFIDGQDLNDTTTLIDIAQAQGLLPEATKQALTERQFLPHVKQDIDLAYQMQVTGVPFVVINRKLAVAGAQPKDVFKQAIQKALS
ncbi:DsbA family oxidoreductase [Salinibius halmophilus]|uniref:DsbA family oxidoreductase n=1 Tax=Salinibius halmophilus TaxID=1853216 RepID=UPI000E66951D|nr:DsbA family oxidoreductase [Salinibius halmophilus]